MTKTWIKETTLKAVSHQYIRIHIWTKTDGLGWKTYWIIETCYIEMNKSTELIKMLKITNVKLKHACE